MIQGSISHYLLAFIETLIFPGTGKLKLTGKLGDVIKESAQAWDGATSANRLERSATQTAHAAPEAPSVPRRIRERGHLHAHQSFPVRRYCERYWRHDKLGYTPTHTPYTPPQYITTQGEKDDSPLLLLTKMSYTPISRVEGRDGRAWGGSEGVCPQALPPDVRVWPHPRTEGHVPPHHRQPAGWPLHSHTQLVVPGASFTCQAENLSEIESENNARKIWNHAWLEIICSRLFAESVIQRSTVSGGKRSNLTPVRLPGACQTRAPSAHAGARDLLSSKYNDQPSHSWSTPQGATAASLRARR